MELVLQKVSNLLTQRRVWIAILNTLVLGLSLLKIELNIDIPVLSEMLTNVGVAIVNVITVILSLWSYLHPKK